MLFNVVVQRGKLTESFHRAKCLVKNSNFIAILSSGHRKDFIYPRSAIKIFQALPFINSGAPEKYFLNEKNFAISCSSHCGELKHIEVLKDWLKKINLSTRNLKCGIHKPINNESSNNLLLNKQKPTQLHNNCSGKHLAMLSGCLANKMEYANYVDYDHPYQQLIRNSLEHFTESSIKQKCIGIDGCNAPQYAFSIDNLTNAIINLINKKNTKNCYSKAICTLLSAITKYPQLIGGKKRFDSEVIKHTQGRIFCKGGAEGVLLFVETSKNIGGIIKIEDGNERAIPPLAMKIFFKLKLLSSNEKRNLIKWTEQILYNHAKKVIGKISAKIML